MFNFSVSFIDKTFERFVCLKWLFYDFETDGAIRAPAVIISDSELPANLGDLPTIHPKH